MNHRYMTKEETIMLVSIFLGSSVGGWAHMIWDGKRRIPRSRIIAGTILSGMAGTIVALLLWEYLSDRPLLVAGISLLAGFGGASALDFLFSIITKKARQMLDK